MELTTEQKLLALASHLCVFLGLGIIAPLIIYIVGKDDYVKGNALEALAFQIAMYIAGIISGILIFVLIGFLLLPIVGIIAIVFPIIAAIRCINGEVYNYPVSSKILKSVMKK